MAASEAPPNLPAIRASDAEREQTAALLKRACVEGRLTVDEFAQRVGQVHAARTRAELQRLTDDLPLAPVPSAVGPVAPPAPAVPRVSTVAILSSAERIGAWRIGAESTVIAVLGSCKLDLRHATVAASSITITARVVMGSLEILVPPGVQVDTDALAFMGSNSDRLAGPPPGPDALHIRVTGFVLLGSVTVRRRS
jgi:hypothetical protein